MFGDILHLKEIVSRRIDPNNRKRILADDLRLHGIYKQALYTLENSIKSEKNKNVKI